MEVSFPNRQISNENNCDQIAVSSFKGFKVYLNANILNSQSS